MTYKVLRSFGAAVLHVVERQGGLTADAIHAIIADSDMRTTFFPNDQVSQQTLSRITERKQVLDTLTHLAAKGAVRRVQQGGQPSVFFYQDTPANRPVSTAPRNKTIHPAPEVDVVVVFVHNGTKYSLPMAVVKAVKEFAL